MATNQGGFMIKTNVLLVAVLLTSACASRPIGAVEESFPPQTQGEEKSTAGQAVTGAAKGALGGAGVCAMPTVAGLYGGPIGFAVGGIISLYCLRFGLAIGALAGGIRGASQ